MHAQVVRLEPSRRYLLTSTRALTAEEKAAFAAMVHDRMTEQVYVEPAKTFKVDAVPAPVFTVPVMEKGRAALEEINSVSERVRGSERAGKLFLGAGWRVRAPLQARLLCCFSGTQEVLCVRERVNGCAGQGCGSVGCECAVLCGL